MNATTYTALKRAIKNQKWDGLKKFKPHDYPMIEEQIDFLDHQGPLLPSRDLLPRFDVFRSLVATDAYRDELVLTFLLFLAKTMNMTKLQHMLLAPYTESLYHWMQLFKYTTYSVVTLVYGKRRWTDMEMFYLDQLVIDLNLGRVEDLRAFLEKIGVVTAGGHPCEAERTFKYNRLVSSDVYGPFYWRMVHLMAEAMSFRPDDDAEGATTLAKGLWREYVTYSMHRTLRCSICRHHYEIQVRQRQKELLASEDYATLWFDIHNDVNALLQRPLYEASRFAEDRRVLRSLLGGETAAATTT